MRGYGAPLARQPRLDPNPEPVLHWFDRRRRWQRRSPYSVFIQPQRRDLALDSARDSIGRLMIAMRIVTPADEQRLCAYLFDAFDYPTDRLSRLRALARNVSIGQSQQ